MNDSTIQLSKKVFEKILAFAIPLAGVFVGMFSTQNIILNRIDNMNADIDQVRTAVTQLRDEASQQRNMIKTEIGQDILELRTDLRRIDDRLNARQNP